MKPVQRFLCLWLLAGAAAFAAGPQLRAKVVDKSGPPSGRHWDMEIVNNAPHTVSGLQVEAVRFTQTSTGGGAACTPAVKGPSSLPVAFGSLLPGGTTRVSLVIDFTGCAEGARFTVDIDISGSGSARGTIHRNHDSP